MKALKITFEHGRIWVAETSDGKRAQSATLRGLLEQLLPISQNISSSPYADEDFDLMRDIMGGIRDSGGSGIARSGQVGG